MAEHKTNPNENPDLQLMTTEISQVPNLFTRETVTGEALVSPFVGPGQVVQGRYEIEKVLGQGGMGIVYKARDRKAFNKPVVIKLLLEHSAGNDYVQTKFIQEGEALARIKHPGVVQVLEVGQLTERQPFVVMEFVSGRDLRSVIPNGGIASFKEIGMVVRQIGQALQAAHACGICHRDLKPENIMLEVLSDGDIQVKLIDFGVAKVSNSQVSGETKVGTTVGSLLYMSVEQLEGKATYLSDIYALGVIAYEMITGRHPFVPTAENLLAAMRQMVALNMNAQFVLPSQIRPDVSKAAEDLIVAALSFYPEQRPQSARELGDKLAVALGQSRTGSLDQTITGKPVITSPVKDAETRTYSGDMVPVPPNQALQGGHVLYAGIVGLNRLPAHQQVDAMHRLQTVVGETRSYREAVQTGRLVAMPAPDGLALAFFDLPMAPVDCAVELSKRLRTSPELQLRMGIHSGPIYRSLDPRTGPAVSGGGVTVAQQMMDCGETGHILVSPTVAHYVRDLGETSFKLQDYGEVSHHGRGVHFYNLFGQGFGNPSVPKVVRESETMVHRTPGTLIVAPQPAPTNSHRTIILVVAILMIGLVLGGIGVLLLGRPHPVPPPPPPPVEGPPEAGQPVPAPPDQGPPEQSPPPEQNPPPRADPIPNPPPEQGPPPDGQPPGDPPDFGRRPPPPDGPPRKGEFPDRRPPIPGNDLPPDGEPPDRRPPPPPGEGPPGRRPPPPPPEGRPGRG